MMRVGFDIPGTPFAKERPRFNRKTGRAYTPGKTESFERSVGTIARQHFPQPFTGPVRVTIFAVFKPALSWSKRKTAAALGRPHTQRPDLDNIEKAILDGLNRIAFADDAQVAEVIKRKTWGAIPNTAVIVEAI